jgi:hypothetical protein
MDQFQPAVVNAVVVQTDVKKKRGRKPKAEGSAPDTTWHTAMIEQMLLLKTRYNADFRNAKDKTALQRGWSRLTLDFNSIMSLAVDIDKVKHKYQDVQRIYRQISNAEIITTGNMKLPKKPEHWDALVSHFGG